MQEGAGIPLALVRRAGEHGRAEAASPNPDPGSFESMPEAGPEGHPHPLTSDEASRISAGAAVLTLGVVIVTAWFALSGLRDARRTRHGQLVIEAMRDWTSPDATQAHALHAAYPERKIIELVDKMFKPGLQATDDERADWEKLSLVANLIEALGVLCSERAITPEVVYKMWGGAILSAWPKWDEAASGCVRPL